MGREKMKGKENKGAKIMNEERKIITELGTEILINKGTERGGRYLGYMIEASGEEKMTTNKITKILKERIERIEKCNWMAIEDKILIFNSMIILPAVYQLQVKGSNKFVLEK